MRTISDLPVALVEEILSRVPLTSLSAVRSTCKTWNALSKTQIFGKTRQQFLGFMMIDFGLYSIKFDLQGLNYESDFVEPSIKRVSILDQLDIFKVFHCEGLLLCVFRGNRWPVVWNPYLGGTGWIQPISDFHKYQVSDKFAFGYENKNRNYKILSAWKVLDVNPDCDIKCGVSLKGKTYFFAKEIAKAPNVKDFLVCFDFTAERFGPRLPLPFHSCGLFSEHVTLSCVRDEHLAVLYRRYNGVMEIYITTKIEPNEVFWSNFLKVDLTTFPDRFYGSRSHYFFIDEEKKVAVVFKNEPEWTMDCSYQTAYIIGKGGYLKSVKFGETPNDRKHNNAWNINSFMLSSYVPSLVQL